LLPRLHVIRIGLRGPHSTYRSTLLGIVYWNALGALVRIYNIRRSFSDSLIGAYSYTCPTLDTVGGNLKCQ